MKEKKGIKERVYLSKKKCSGKYVSKAVPSHRCQSHGYVLECDLSSLKYSSYDFPRDDTTSN